MEDNQVVQEKGGKGKGEERSKRVRNGTCTLFTMRERRFKRVDWATASSGAPSSSPASSTACAVRATVLWARSWFNLACLRAQPHSRRAVSSHVSSSKGEATK